MTTLQAAGFINKLAGGWFAPSSPPPTMDGSLKAAPSKGMTGSTPVGTGPGMPPSSATSKAVGDRAKPPESYALKMNKASEGKIPASELKKGIKVEKEHTDTVGNSPAKFKSIAMDHLKERPDYYTQLAKMEAKPVENTMKDAAIKGFIDKCAELGVDPTVAIKFVKQGQIIPQSWRWINPGYWPLGLINGIMNKYQTGRFSGTPPQVQAGRTGVSVPGTAQVIQQQKADPNNQWENVPGNR